MPDSGPISGSAPAPIQPIELPTSTPELKQASQGFLKRALLKKLEQLTECELTIVEGSERMVFGYADGSNVIRTTIRVINPDLWHKAAANGSVGVAESYMDGDWQTDDLVAVIQIFVRNRSVLDAMELGFAKFAQMALRVWHRLRRNTQAGSKKNIAEHYDLSNALFATFLDSTMMYSSAIYEHASDTLEVASVRKLDRICQKLALTADDHVIEIGTGWGGFAVHAAKHYGCKVTTTTISEEQYQFAQKRVADAGLGHLVNVLKQDYRELAGQYSKLVSIEMIEAIGHHYVETYFAKLAALLKPNGLALIQAITIEDQRYAQALKDVDFIKRYIFPGSFIPSITAILTGATAASDLKLVNLEDIGSSYALTLREWRKRFNSALPAVRELGFNERFIRMWNFYFAYCEGGFMERAISDVHLLFAKPRNLRTQYLPDLRSSV